MAKVQPHRLSQRCGRWALTPPRPPSFEASWIEALRELWSDAGLDAIETREIVVQRTFNDFDDFWTTTLLIPTLGPTFALMPSKETGLLKTRVRSRLRQMQLAVSPTKRVPTP